jgi:protein-ribulosamine 3-kinase
MSLPSALVGELNPYIGRVRSANPVGGGCISNGTRVEADGTVYFVKWSDGEARLTFDAEAVGLRALAKADSPLRVPAVVASGTADGGRLGYLVTEYLEEGRPAADFWDRFGEGLAELHRSQEERFGFDSDNFIGRLPQLNEWVDQWPDFFRERRILPQLTRARESGMWDRSWDARLDRLLQALPSVLPTKPTSSLLHGDLWSGNYLVAGAGTAALIDPAVYFGDRETDLAMMLLFGGFAPRLFEAYASSWPLDAGWRERVEIYQLYHLINHLNHFGGSYGMSVEAVLRKW